MLGVERFRRAVGVGRLEHLVEPDVAPGAHLAVAAGVAHHEHRLDRRVVAFHDSVNRLLDRRRLALASRAVNRDQRLGLRELHALAHRLGREPAEHDVVRCPDASAGEHRDDHLGDHRQVDADHVAAFDAVVDQRVGEPLNVAQQLGVGDVALLALLAAPVERDASPRPAST